MSALLAFVTISLVVGNAIQLRITQTVAEGRAGVLSKYVTVVTLRLCLIGGALALALLLAAYPIATSLHASFAEVALAGLSIIGVLFLGCGNGLTSGLHQLEAQAWGGLLATVIKVGLLVAMLGFGGDTLAVLISYAVGVWIVFPLSLLVVCLKRNALPPHSGTKAVGRADGVVLFLTYLLVTAPFMLDQVLVQSIAPALSGHYSALATLGKVVFYGCAPVMTVAFPYLAWHRYDTRMQLRYATLGGLATFGVALVITTLLAGRSDLFVRLFFTAAYSEITPLVRIFALAVLLYVAAHFITIVYIARGKRGVLLPLSFGLLAQVILFANGADTVEALAQYQLWTYAILLAALVLYSAPQIIGNWRRGGAPASRSVDSTSVASFKTLVYLHPHFTIAGGAGKYVLETGSRFAALGFKVVVISIRADDHIVGGYRGSIEFVDIGGPLSSSLWFWATFPCSVMRVIRILGRYPESIIFAQVFPANWWGFMAKFWYPRRPLVWMCQEPSAFIHSRTWLAALPRGGAGAFARALNPILRRIDVALAQQADLVFTNSHFGQRYAQQVYRYPIGRIVPVYLGVDAERFSSVDVALRKQIVSVGRLTEFKRFDVVVGALKLVHDRGFPDMRLVIIGRGEAENTLKALVGTLGLDGCVDFRGAVPDEVLVDELRSSLALVLASVDEPFGLVAVEAMSCGTPAIVTSTGGPAETVVDGESGFLVPPGDASALADKIELLCRDTEALARLRRGATRRAKMFSWDETVALSRRHIEDLVKSDADCCS